jgi:hypothetical protein
MRSTKNAVLVAGALASSSLLGMTESPALAQSYGGGATSSTPAAGYQPNPGEGYPATPSASYPTMPGVGYLGTSGAGYPVTPGAGRNGMPAYPINPPMGTSGMSGYPTSPSAAGNYGASTPARAAYPMSPAGATASGRPLASPGGSYPIGTPGTVAGQPGAADEAVRTSYATPTAGSPAASAAHPPTPGSPNGGPTPGPAGPSDPAAPGSPIKPYLASVPSPADAPKPKGMRKILSYIWHGGSNPEDEGKPTQRDYSTGRTDLPNARPWMKSTPSGK